MILLIGGHQRSGTTLLRDLCHFHPDFCITNEFNAFMDMGRSFHAYQKQIFRAWYRKGLITNDVFRVPDKSFKCLKGAHIFRGNIFVFRFLLSLQQYRKRRIDTEAVRKIYERIFPDVPIIGDKWPDYVYTLGRFGHLKNFSQLVIYRDCRDVVSSFLEKARTDWKNQAWITRFDTAEKIAGRWVSTIDAMECHRGTACCIKYEHLVHNPMFELEKIGYWLGVDPKGFPAGIIRNTSIGRHKRSLTTAELSDVLRIAGRTMTRLGYC